MFKHEAKEFVIKTADFLDEKKAEDIIIIDIEEISGFTDYFLIASCRSYVQLNTLSKLIIDNLTKEGIKPINPRDNEHENPWIVIDYMDFVIHLFHEDIRQVYDLEKLWHDGEIIWKQSVNSKIENEINEVKENI